MTVCAWGSLYVVSRYLLIYLSPFVILAGRHLIAAVTLFILLHKKKIKANGQCQVKREDWKYFIIIGVFGHFFCVATQLIGTALSGAAIASLINSLNPVVMILIAVPLLKEKITIKKIIAIFFCTVGVLIIIENIKGKNTLMGIVFSLISVLIWSLISVLMKKLANFYDPQVIVTYSMPFALLFSIPLAIKSGIDLTWNFKECIGIICGLLYLGIVCTAMTNILWNKSLKLIEAGKCAMFYPLQPVIATILSAIFLQEKIEPDFVKGSSLVLLGVFIGTDVIKYFKIKRSE